ncbi:MAG: hypothetical protein V2I54_05890 [Bacteroidales bacterium]|jgi:hypothetical protein|nr:hypothetical protein [Bacteroidales bacterium]
MKFFLLTILGTIFFYQALGQWIIKDTLFFAGNNEPFWHSSSELEPGDYWDYGKYGALNLGDHNPATCWAEGNEGDGAGEYILMTIPSNIYGLKIRNGYQKSENLYQFNNRPKKIKVEILGCYTPPGYITETHIGFAISEPIAINSILLKDQWGFQDVPLSYNWSEITKQVEGNELFDQERFILKITIEDIYKGTQWNDACISDIMVIPEEIFEITADEHGLTKIFNHKIDTLFYDPENIFQIIDLTEDSEWIIFILMPAEIENSRAETIYKLYNTQKLKFIDTGDIIQMHGFVEKDGKLFLVGFDKDFNEKSIYLNHKK